MMICVLFSLTACNGNSGNTEPQQNAGISTRGDQEISQIPGPGVDEPHQEIDPGANIAEPTDEPIATSEPVAQSGTYSYTVYGKTLSMDINIEDYILTSNKGNKFFLIYDLARSLGWTTDRNDDDPYDACSAESYFYKDGDMTTWIQLDCYRNDNQQLMIFDGRHVHDDLTTYSGYRTFVCYFSEHNCDYRLNGLGWSLSYDDIVILSYTLWLASTNPGEDPLLSGFGENFEYIKSRSSNVYEYNLP